MCREVILTLAVFVAALTPIALLIAHHNAIATLPNVGLFAAGDGDAERGEARVEAPDAVGDSVGAGGEAPRVAVGVPLGGPGVDALVCWSVEFLAVGGEVEKKGLGGEKIVGKYLVPGVLHFLFAECTAINLNRNYY